MSISSTLRLTYANRLFTGSILALLGTACQSKPAASMADLDWQPNTRLQYPVRQLEDILAKEASQQEMNFTSSNLAFVLDANLYFLFSEYLATLPDSQRMRAVQEQKQWLMTRTQKTHDGYMEYVGGSLAPLSGNSAFIDATKERITELTARLPKTAPCAYEPKVVELTGFIRKKASPDLAHFHPNVDYEAAPETYWILHLTKPIEVAPDPSSDLNAEGASDITDIQLNTKEELPIGERLTLRGTLYRAHTGHHHETILMTVESVRKP